MKVKNKEKLIFVPCTEYALSRFTVPHERIEWSLGLGVLVPYSASLDAIALARISDFPFVYVINEDRSVYQVAAYNETKEKCLGYLKSVSEYVKNKSNFYLTLNGNYYTIY